MIKNILFDCAGVLTHMNFHGMMQELSGSKEIADSFVAKLWTTGSPWHRFDKGELNSQQIVEELIYFLPRPLHPYLSPMIENFPDMFPPMDGMEALVDELHAQGYPCYLLSNFPDRFAEMPARTPVLQKLDGMVISYEVQSVKPEPEIYRALFEKYDLIPEECVFLDDREEKYPGRGELRHARNYRTVQKTGTGRIGTFA